LKLEEKVGQLFPDKLSNRKPYDLTSIGAKAPVWGYSPPGMDVDGNGVVWVALGK
jgi:hypothetical protein